MTKFRLLIETSVVPLLLASMCGSAFAQIGEVAAPNSPQPTILADDSGLQQSGFGQLSFTAHDGNKLTAQVYRSTNFDAESGAIWFVMHGASRDVERYIRTAAPVAERNNALAIAILFPKVYYPASKGFTLGVTTAGDPDDRALAEGRWRQPDDYLYAEVEHVFEAVRQSLNSSQSGYLLFGHSAGAQFTHRLMTFLPQARVLGAVAANAGWYTLPISGSGASYSMPYGLRETPLSEADVQDYLAAPLTVLLGERDIATPATSSMVRGTTEAMVQGRSRLARGKYFYAMGQARARSLNVPFNWRFGIVPSAKHSASEMIASAAFFLFGNGDLPCESNLAADASDLMITEILADPPQGEAGDANGDGVRDPAADEFVELVNTGSASICLSGWLLGDADDPERHVFPLGRELAPGQAMVIFGGGLPTGPFGEAEIQWAAFGGQLNLSNEGDVLTLADASGAIAKQISWGDCAELVCAEEHIPRGLGINESIVSGLEPGGEWKKHSALSGAKFSPGLRTDGGTWHGGQADE